MISICFVHFKPLTVANLEASLYSVRQQDLSRVREIVFIDNDSGTSVETIHRTFDTLDFPCALHTRFFRHGDSSKTHPWSSNQAMKLVSQPWILFTRADYLLEPSLLGKFSNIVTSRPEGWSGFVTASGCHLPLPVETYEQLGWRVQGLSWMQGAVYDYTHIDAGVWMARKAACDHVGGLDERLSAWGHAQTHFQWKLYKDGVEFVRVPEVLFYHPAHGGEKNLGVAHRQLADIGLDIRELWARYDGPRIY